MTVTDPATQSVCPAWCTSRYPSHLDWQNLVREPGLQDRTHTHDMREGSVAFVSMDQRLDPATGVVTDRVPYIYVGIDEFEDVEITSGRAREIAADLLAAAAKLDEITAVQR